VGQALLIHGSSEMVLFAIDSDEDFGDKELVAVTLVVSFQYPGV